MTRFCIIALGLMTCAPDQTNQTPPASDEDCVDRCVERESGTWIVLEDNRWAFIARDANMGCFWPQDFDPCENEDLLVNGFLEACTEP